MFPEESLITAQPSMEFNWPSLSATGDPALKSRPAFSPKDQMFASPCANVKVSEKAKMIKRQIFFVNFVFIFISMLNNDLGMNCPSLSKKRILHSKITQAFVKCIYLKHLP